MRRVIITNNNINTNTDIISIITTITIIINTNTDIISIITTNIINTNIISIITTTIRTTTIIMLSTFTKRNIICICFIVYYYYYFENYITTTTTTIMIYYYYYCYYYYSSYYYLGVHKPGGLRTKRPKIHYHRPGCWKSKKASSSAPRNTTKQILKSFQKMYDVQILTVLRINYWSVNAWRERKASVNKNALVFIY